MAEPGYDVRSNTLKPLTNAQTVRGRPTSKHENERAVLSISLSTALVFCVIVHVSIMYTNALSTRAMLNVLGKCDVLGEAMQPFVHHQHDGVAKIKFREELRSRYAKFVY